VEAVESLDAYHVRVRRLLRVEAVVVRSVERQRDLLDERELSRSSPSSIILTLRRDP
jgi:hypothetical protein